MKEHTPQSPLAFERKEGIQYLLSRRRQRTYLDAPVAIQVFFRFQNQKTGKEDLASFSLYKLTRPTRSHRPDLAANHVEWALYLF
jgi:hypothetical protein